MHRQAACVDSTIEIRVHKGIDIRFRRDPGVVRGKESPGILCDASICEDKVQAPVFGEDLVKDSSLLLVVAYIRLVEGCIVQCGSCGFTTLFVAADDVDLPVCGAVESLGDV